MLPQFLGGRRKGPISRPNFISTINDQTEGHFRSSLRPFRRGTMRSQSPTGDGATYIQVAGTGEGTTVDGHDYPVLVPYTMTNFVDTAGLAQAGGPQQGDDLLIQDTSPGNPVVLGRLVQGRPKQPYVSQITAGTGLKSTAYSDALVIAPTLAIDTAQALTWTGQQTFNAGAKITGALDWQSTAIQLNGTAATGVTTTAVGTIAVTINGTVYHLLYNTVA